MGRARSSVVNKSKRLWGSDPLVVRTKVAKTAAGHVRRGLAPTSIDSYASARRSWELFCELTDRVPVYPADEDGLMQFAAWSALRVCADSIRAYITGIRSLHIELQLPLPSSAEMNLLRRCLNGIDYALRPNKLGELRMPITFAVLLAMHDLFDTWTWSDVYDLPESPIMLAAVFDLAFFTAARPSEIAVRHTSVGWSVPLAFRNLGFWAPSTKSGTIDGAMLCLDKMKNDQTGADSTMVFGRSGHARVCAVSSLLRWLRAREAAGEVLSDSSLLFPVRDKKSGALVPLNYAAFAGSIKRTLDLAGYPQPLKHCGFSFRVGAATTMAENDVSPALIMAVGRWRSDCWKRYVRSSDDKRASTASLMVVQQSR